MTGYRARAACRDADPELFFPTDERPGSDGVLAAKAVCARCPVWAECLAESLDRRDRHGVFGGLAPDERRALHPNRRVSVGRSRI